MPDATLVEQVLDISRKKLETDVKHDGQEIISGDVLK